MRISGITIPDGKRLEIALTAIYGIGRPLARRIIDEAGMHYGIKPKEVNAGDEQRIRKIIEGKLKIEGDLKREVAAHIRRLKDIKATEARATRKIFLHAVSAPRPTHGRVAAMCARRWAPDARSLKRNSPTSSLYILMGKKRIVKKGTEGAGEGAQTRAAAKLPRRKMEHGILSIEATYNNTKVLLCDGKGNPVLWSSSGSLGFKGAKKGTPFAAAKVGELLAEKAEGMGLKEIDVVIRGVGSGRESAMRAFASRGFSINSIKDKTPVPHNGPRPEKPRRV